MSLNFHILNPISAKLKSTIAMLSAHIIKNPIVNIVIHSVSFGCFHFFLFICSLQILSENVNLKSHWAFSRNLLPWSLQAFLFFLLPFSVLIIKSYLRYFYLLVLWGFAYTEARFILYPIASRACWFSLRQISLCFSFGRSSIRNVSSPICMILTIFMESLL